LGRDACSAGVLFVGGYAYVADGSGFPHTAKCTLNGCIVYGVEALDHDKSATKSGQLGRSGDQLTGQNRRDESHEAAVHLNQVDIHLLILPVVLVRTSPAWHSTPPSPDMSRARNLLLTI
jgi:hypothetical protein